MLRAILMGISIYAIVFGSMGIIGSQNDELAMLVGALFSTQGAVSLLYISQVSRKGFYDGR